MYKLVEDVHPVTGNTISSILRIADNASIPFDEANRDYQEYLEWLAEGNTPEPADSQET